MPQRMRHGFTIVEAAVCVAALGAAGALTAVGTSRSRAEANLAICTAKLGVMGAGSAQFALTHNGKMAGFLSQDRNGRGTSALHATEAVGILRSRGRPDMPDITGWFPDPGYWSLSLVEFQDRSLSDPFNICPSDDLQNKWRRHPAAFDQGRFLPYQPTPSPNNKRWPYNSSYDLSGAAMDLNQSVDVGATTSPTVTNRVHQSGNPHTGYYLPHESNVGPSPMSMVAMPSRKAHVFERYGRHFGPPHPYFMFDAARTTILFFDGSVRVEQSADANEGWNPQSPGLHMPTGVSYSQAPWDPPNPFGGFAQDSHKWTRDGLLGWDYLE